MAASYPTAVKTFTTKNADDTLQPADPNDLQDEVNAIEAGLLNGTARLNSSASTLASVHVTGASTLAGNVACTGIIGSSGARVQTLWVGQLEASSGAGSTLTGCALRRLTSQVLSTGVEVAVLWTDQVFDLGSLHSTATNPSRINLVSSGYWTMIGGVLFEVGGAAEQYLYWRLNGVSTGALGPAAEVVGEVSAAHTGLVAFGAHYATSTADYVELMAFTKDGANLNPGGLPRGYPHALVQRIG